ncbi:MAG: TIGR01212 family radical SAM protein [Clostridia bacterium]|nr:TIGR01212 family radical SAM protein [Clostridia bacterium]
MILSEYLKKEYGEKLYKIYLHSGCICPGRCAFCAHGGSSVSPDAALPLEEQYKGAVAAISRKYRNGSYIAYFGSYTNTYGDPTALEALYRRALALDGVKILSIATRPDCLGPQMLDMLSRLRQIAPVWVELGLQTGNEAAATAFGRGYDNACYVQAAQELRRRGIVVITHCILGLPNDEDFAPTAKLLNACTDGVKFTQLYLVRDSAWAESDIPTLSLEDYTERLMAAIGMLDERIVLHRLTGDPPQDALIAPKWCKDKRRANNYIRKRLSNADTSHP